MKTVLTLLVLCSVAASVSAASYLQVALSIGDAFNATTASSPAQEVYCPLFVFPNTTTYQAANLVGHPSPNAFSSGDNHPVSTFYLQLDTCAPMYLPHDAGLVAAITFPYYLSSNGTGKVRFRYFCNADCSACSLDAIYTIGTCNKTSDVQFVSLLGGTQLKRAIIAFNGAIMNRTDFEAALSTNATTRQMFGGDSTVVTMQYADQTCGGTKPDPVFYRVGFGIGANMGGDCFVGALAVTSSYQATCTQINSTLPWVFNVAQATDGACQGFAATNPVTSAPAQPSYKVLPTNSGETYCKTVGSTLSTWSVCAGALSGVSLTSPALVPTTVAPTTAAPAGSNATTAAAGAGTPASSGGGGPTTAAATAAPSSASSLVASFGVFLALLLAVLSL